MSDEDVSPHLEKGAKGDNLNVSTGTPTLWHNIIKKLYLQVI